jgi:hypothetical protein
MLTRLRLRSLLIPGCVAVAMLTPGFATAASARQAPGAAAVDAAAAAPKFEVTTDAAKGASVADPKKGLSNDTHVPPTRADTFGQILQSIQQFISGVLSWAVVTVILLIVFRAQFTELLKSLISAIHDRGVQLDLGTVMKLQVTEPPIDSVEELPGASESPFDLPDDSSASDVAALREIAPQLGFDISDSVGRYHKDDDHGRPALEMRAAREALRGLCETPRHTDVELRIALVGFARRFEAARFLEGRRFAEMLNEHAALRNMVNGLPTVDPVREADNFVVLMAVATAYAQEGRNWVGARAALERIALKDRGPWYLPAGALWTSCEYLAYLATIDGDFDPEAYFGKVDELAAVGTAFVEAIKAGPWPHGLGAPHAYYIREALKGLGFVLSIAAEYAVDRTQRGDLLRRSEKLLEDCAQDMPSEAASAIDFNNLADLFRQVAVFTKPDKPDVADDYYRKALDYSLRAIDRRDPAFFHTRALIFYNQGRIGESLETLASYRAEEADQGDPQDLTQYIENQIFAAKLLWRAGTDGEPPDWERLVWTLERAMAFVERRRNRWGVSQADRTIAEIHQMLGFAYLQWPGHESKAITAINHLFDLEHVKIPVVSHTRSRLYRGQARTRWARTQRRQFTRGSAASARKDAATDLMAAAGRIRPIIEKPQAGGAAEQRTWRLALDIAVALQSLADERFVAEERAAVRELTDEQGKILSCVRAARLDGTIVGDDQRQVFERLDHCQMRRSFLAARVAIASDPLIADDTLIHSASVSLNEARGLDADLDCHVDIVLGELLLNAARLGKGDVAALYRAAVDCLERAIRHDAPTARTEATLALAAAYSARRSILRKAKPSAAQK